LQDDGMKTPTGIGSPVDIRQAIFESISSRTCAFGVTTREQGILAGMRRASLAVRHLRRGITIHAHDGERIEPGQCVLEGSASPVAVSQAEEVLLGCLGKPSGIATAAARAREIAGGRGEVVCGGWKKWFPEVKDEVRGAVEAGGVRTRISSEPMIYVDKNCVRMHGGVGAATAAAARTRDAQAGNGAQRRIVAVQIREDFGSIEDEAAEAARAGADIVMVDTGDLNTLKKVVALREAHKIPPVKVAFGGGATLRGLADVFAAGADIVDVGRAIIDAPMLDFALDVVGW
jgi:nicotinate-nucleotide pyrophosphorylase (carboxylating)